MVNFVKDATGQSATATFRDESERDQANADLTRQELTTIIGFRPNGDVEVGNHFLITIKSEEFAYAEDKGHSVTSAPEHSHAGGGWVQRGIQTGTTSPDGVKHPNQSWAPEGL